MSSSASSPSPAPNAKKTACLNKKQVGCLYADAFLLVPRLERVQNLQLEALVNLDFRLNPLNKSTIPL